MSDLISRQAAIEAIMGEPTDAHYPSWYAERLEQLPSAQPEQRWIPVTKKLPEEMAVVLVYTSVDGYFTAYFDGICWYHAGLHMMRIYSDVVAWMPLPKPYEGGEQDGNQREGS